MDVVLAAERHRSVLPVSYLKVRYVVHVLGHGQGGGLLLPMSDCHLLLLMLEVYLEPITHKVR